MRTHTRTVAGLLAAAALAITSCSSSSSDTPDEPGVTATASSNTGGTAKTKTDAASITQQLTTKVPTARLDLVYTQTTDPNGKLGRPHQYTSKTAFIDSRIDPKKAREEASTKDAHPISAGGTVEVFTTEDDAKAWVTYIDKIGQAVGGLVTPDYLLRQDRYVLRVSHLLTPDQVEGYKAALADVS